ncbi:hypothetical protein D3869_25780 (plasmid) [Azospirillum brasilense]|uniref:Amidase domain-containing protein n=1 Tax=Azospirillum brasilense TaxID=192 RepID=A0A4D8RDA8_AZOBR|nr:hypothetical protein D3869_25780 [Azospirillum brasilense]
MSELSTAHPARSGGGSPSMPGTSEAETRARLARIESLNPIVNALLAVDADGALRRARAQDEARAAGDWPGLLDGVTVTIKDCFELAGETTSYGSSARFARLGRQDAPLVRRLRDAGAILVGRNNLSEFCLGSTNQNEHHAPAGIPGTPGGCPAGRAAVRRPRSPPGCAGSPSAPTPAAPSASGGALRGGRAAAQRRPGVEHRHDPVQRRFRHHRPVGLFRRRCGARLRRHRRLRPGGPELGGRAARQFPAGFEGGDRRCAHRIAAELLLRQPPARGGGAGARGGGGAGEGRRRLGGHHHRGRGGGAGPHRLLAARRRHGAIPPRQDGDRPGVHRAGGAAPPAARPAGVRRAVRGIPALAGLLEAAVPRVVRAGGPDHHPDHPIVAPRIYDSADMIEATRAVSRFTYGFGALGLPAMSVPCGFDGDGMPVGMQIVGRWFDEPLVFRAGAAFQAATDHHRQRPALPL